MLLVLYFNEESHYSEKNKCDNKVFRFTILQPFQFESEQKKKCGNEGHQKETKHIHASAADLLNPQGGCIEIDAYRLSSGQFLQFSGDGGIKMSKSVV